MSELLTRTRAVTTDYAERFGIISSYGCYTE